MVWALSDAGAGWATNGFGTSVTPVANGTWTAGDIGLIAFGGFPVPPTPTTPAGWSLQNVQLGGTPNNSLWAWLRILQLGDVMPAITVASNTTGIAAIFKAYSGGPTTLTGIIDLEADQRQNQTINFATPGGSATPANDNTITILVAIRAHTNVSTGNAFAAPANYTLRNSFSLANSSTQGVYCDWIQGAKTALGISQATATGTADAAVQAADSFRITLIPGIVVPVGYQSLPDRQNPLPPGLKSHQQEFWQVPIELRSIPAPTLPPGQNTFLDFVSTKPKSNVTLGIEFSMPRTLIGQDKLLTPVNWEYSWDPPQLPLHLRADNYSLTANELTNLSTFPPYIETNWPLPLVPRQFNRGFEQPLNLCLIGKDNIPLGAARNLMWDPPPRPRQPVSSLGMEASGLALTQTVQVKPPLSVSDWPVPRRPAQNPQDFIAGMPVIVEAFLTTIPPSQGSQDVPLRRPPNPNLGFVHAPLALLFGKDALPPSGRWLTETGFFRAPYRDIYSITSPLTYLSTAPVPPLPPPSPTAPNLNSSPGGRVILMPKKAGETVTRPFDFISRLGNGESLTSAIVLASVYSGVDPNAQAIVNGTATIVGTVVNQSLTAGIVGVIYELLCKANTNLGQVLEISAFWVVETDLP